MPKARKVVRVGEGVAEVEEAVVVEVVEGEEAVEEEEVELVAVAEEVE